MTDEEINVYQSAIRMLDFNTAHPDIFSGNQMMTDGFTAITAEIARLEAAGADRVQGGSLRSDATADKRAVRSDLYKLVRKMADTAKLIKEKEPNFDNVFKIRRGTLRAEELLDVARAFAEDLTPDIVQKFKDYGASKVSAEALNAKIAAFEAARTQQNEGKGEGIAATGETKAAIKRLRAERRSVKEIGENILDDNGDEGLKAEWQSACRLERRRENKPDEPEEGENPA